MTGAYRKLRSYGCVAPLLGVPVTFLGLIPLTGGVGEAASLLVLSIVCTAGIGLVFWIPVWWVMGSVTLALIGIYVQKQVSEEEATHERPLIGRDELALTEYIRHAKARGMSNDEIASRLRWQGWSDDAIQRARQRLNA